MIEIDKIDYHVADACNLSCEFCTHYSNFRGPANFKTVEQCEGEWAALARRVNVAKFNIIGGEPLLNPEIVDIVLLAFRTWPRATICLYSNGLLLKNHPGLRWALKGGQLILGLHYCDDRDRATEQHARQFFLGTGVPVYVVDGAAGWLQHYKIEDGQPVPYNDGNQRASWENCIAAQQRCFVLKDNRLWKCPQVAFAKRAGISWFDDYESCGLDQDIEKWAALEDEPCCRNCPATQQFTPHGSGFMVLRKPSQ